MKKLIFPFLIMLVVTFSFAQNNDRNIAQAVDYSNSYISQKENTPEIQIVDHPNLSIQNLHYTSTRSPLQKFPFLQIPLGNILPKGWLQTQLERMVEGYTGFHYKFSSFLGDNSGWLGGNEPGWEEAPYWLRGFYDLSVLTKNKRIDSVAYRWIEAIINSQDKDGYYGSIYNKFVVSETGKDSLTDLWPHMVMNDVLISHYEATKDERVIPMLTKFFMFCHNLPDNFFLKSYDNFDTWKPFVQLSRAGDFIPQVYWLYNHTGEKRLLDLALEIYHKTSPPRDQWLDDHVVNFMQRFRYPAQIYPLTGDDYYLDQTNFFYNQMMQTWGNMPRGAFAADERIRHGKIDPRQAFESCAIVEGNKSFYILGDITGDVEYADKIEDITFNWLPAFQSPDLKTLRYLTAANMVNSVSGMDFRNQGTMCVFAANKYRCCQHNTGMGWPWFIKNMWKASPDNGIVAWLYGPNEVHAKVGKDGINIHIISSTSYPFSDQVNYQITLDKAVHFPFYLRIPVWAKKLSIKVNNKDYPIENQQGRYIKIEQEWRNNDQVIIEFKPAITLTEWPRTKSVTVNRGPLSYSVRIKENWIKTGTDKFGWDEWEVLPGSDWNYGIITDNLDLNKDIRIKVEKTMPEQPWDEQHVPIILEIPAKKILAWEASVKNTVDPLREGPIRSDEEKEWIEMIPMGAAHLRLTCIPVISEDQNSRYWDEIPDPNKFMRNSFSH